MTERERFEKWYLSKYDTSYYLLYGVEEGEEYFYENLQDMWDAWQAAKQDAEGDQE
jgi:hypothetical protein